MLKSLQKIKKIVMAALSVCAILCFVGSATHFVNAAEGDLSATYTKVAHYEFDDSSNLGKDTLGNYDLVNAGGVVADTINGGAIFGKENGFLYAPDLGEGKDFSDLIDGSFSVSMRLYICDVWEGGNYIIATGSYGSNFCAEWTYGGIVIHTFKAICVFMSETVCNISEPIMESGDTRIEFGEIAFSCGMQPGAKLLFGIRIFIRLLNSNKPLF